jgi:hypothetical protein
MYSKVDYHATDSQLEGESSALLSDIKHGYSCASSDTCSTKTNITSKSSVKLKRDSEPELVEQLG